MTVEEFSNEFDTLLNSYSTVNQFGKIENPLSIELDEYEKSIFLTKAEEEIVHSLYSGENPLGDSFEKTERIRRYLDKLVKTYTTTDKKSEYSGLSPNSIFFELPEDLWFITYESVTIEDDRLGCLNNSTIIVVPITQDEYYRVSRNPFRGAGEKRALRLDISDNIVEIVSEYNVSKYLVRYISKPEPIILVDLPDNLSINGVNTKTECKLNPVIHRAILEKAVKLAILSKAPSAGK